MIETDGIRIDECVTRANYVARDLLEAAGHKATQYLSSRGLHQMSDGYEVMHATVTAGFAVALATIFAAESTHDEK